MYRSSKNDAPAHQAVWRNKLLLSLLPCAALAAHAQTGAAAGDGAPSEAARRAATSPYRFILQHANAPAPVRKVAPDKERERERDKDKVETVRKLAPPSEAPVQSAAQTARAAAAPVAPLAATEPAQTAPAVAEPVQSAARTPAAEPRVAVRREIIPLRTDEPRLAAALLRERPNGVVRVQFDVQPDGSTSAVKVLTSSNRALNRATVDAVSGWKFQPVDEVLTVETEIAYKYD
jgi:TonB family protein